MTPTRHGKTGHLRRTGDRERSYCGRRLAGGVFFTDEAARPTVCLICSRGFQKERGVDHGHVVFRDGRWWFALPLRWITIMGAGLTSMSTMCGIDGCKRMVPNIPIPAVSANTGAQNATYYYVAA